MRNILLAVLALVFAGGGFAYADKKVEEKKLLEPKTTAPTEAVEVVCEESQDVKVTEKTVEEKIGEVTENIVKEDEPVTEKVAYVTEKSEVKVTETENPTEKATETETKVHKKEEKVENKIDSAEKITHEDAKRIALKHAGLTEADVRDLEVDFDFDDGAYEYEVSFESGKYDYEYDIDAVSGEIRFSEKEIDD